jgi:HEAT repeat protein
LRAVQAIAAAGSPRALGALKRACEDEDADVVKSAAVAIGAIGNEAALNFLTGALRSPRIDLRFAAVEALKDFRGEKVLAELAARLQDEDAEIRNRAARSLQRALWKPSNMQDEIWFHISIEKTDAAAACGPEAIEPLEMVARDGPEGLKMKALRALGKISDERVLKVLLPYLQSTDHMVSVAAIEALTGFGGPKAADGIAGALKHHNHMVRVAAAEALAVLPAKNITQALTRLLKDKHWDVRRAAAMALGRIVDPLATDSLIELLSDPDYDVRESAIFSLGRVRDLRAIGPLVMSLVDAETSVRRTAAYTLQRIHSQWAQTEDAQKRKPELRATMMNSEDLAVRYAARSALKVLGGEIPQADAVYLGDEVAAASHKHTRVFTFFFYLLGDIDREVRLAAAETLGRLGDRRAASALMSALSDVDSFVKAAASRSLEALGTT